MQNKKFVNNLFTGPNAQSRSPFDIGREGKCSPCQPSNDAIGFSVTVQTFAWSLGKLNFDDDLISEYSDF